MSHACLHAELRTTHWEATFRTPRTSITAFIGLLAVLVQNPGAAWQALVQQTQVDIVKAPEATHSGNELSDLII